MIHSAAIVVVFVVYAASAVRDHLSSPESSVDEAKRLYQEGKIDEPELERRLAEAVDDRHEQIRLPTS